jgi:hypothetical protein
LAWLDVGMGDIPSSGLSRPGQATGFTCIGLGFAVIAALTFTPSALAAQSSPSITATPIPVGVGALITVNVANGPGNTNDWVGLVATGDPDTSYIAWQFLNGATSTPPTGLTNATLQFVAPMTPGTYTARLFADGWNRLAISSPVTVETPAALASSITATPTTVSAGAPIIVTANGPGQFNDWVGLVAAGAPDTSYIAWQYLNGLTTPPATGFASATLQFMAPMTPGTYTARLFTNGWTRLAISSQITVQAPLALINSITALPMTVPPGASITVTANGPGQYNDWVGLVDVNAPDTSYVAWQYLNGLTTLPVTGLTSATLHFVAPMTPGTYTARLFTNGWTRLAISSPVTVQAPPISITASPMTVGVGAPITVTAANGPGHFNDWVGLVEASTPDSGYIAWQYLNGATTPPATGLTSATLQFVAPMTPGTYTARLFTNGWTRLAISNPVTVPAPVMLAWDASTASTLAGYRVYVGTSSGVYSFSVDVDNITNYDVSVPSGSAYYFAVTARDQSGAESGFSNEVRVDR